MSSSDSGKKTSSAVFFASATLLAGVLNYLYQLSAAKNLNQVEFGALSSWLAYISLFLIAGSFGQFVSNFFPVKGSRLKLILLGLSGVSLISLIAPFWIEDSEPYIKIGAIVVFLGPVFAWLSGQVQARLLFYSLGFGVVFSALFKLLFATVPLPGLSAELQYYWSFVYGFAPPALFLMVILLFSREDHLGHRSENADSSRKEFVQKLSSSLVLSFLAVFLPAMDILVIDATQTDEVLGLFARISLIYKVIFFGLFVFSQWLLPHQMMSTGRSNTGVFNNHWVKYLLAVGGVSALVASGAALTAPIAADWVMGFELYSFRSWIWLTCFNITALKAAYFLVQKLATEGRPSSGMIFSAVLILECLVLMQLSLSVFSYLVVVTIVNFVAFVWLSAQMSAERYADTF